MIRVYDAAAVDAALPFDRLVPALQAAFAAPPGLAAESPARHRHALPGNAVLLLMPAWTPRWLGTKLVTVHPGNASRGLGAVHATYVLSDAETGAPVAILDGDALTGRRTAAASALAASFLAARGASRLLLLGAGRVAALLPAAHQSVRPIREVMVWNRGAERRDGLVAALRGQGFEARAVEDLAAAVGEADIVSAATLANEPLIRGEWLRGGQHVDLVGAYMPGMREADHGTMERARVYADTETALAECGELAGWGAEDLCGTLFSLTKTPVSRHDPGQVTVFKSVGTALEDLAAATLVASPG